MPFLRQERADLHALLLETFGRTARFGAVLTLMERNIEDLATSETTRAEKYLQVIVTAHEQGWLSDLFVQLYESEDANEPFRERLGELYARIWPQGDPAEPHTHLLTMDTAFVNRDTLREHLFHIASNGFASVLILTGTGLAGTSYCWRLINHVATNVTGIKKVYINFDRLADRSPQTVMEAIAHQAGFEPPPRRNDLLTDGGNRNRDAAQLAQFLTQWFLGQAGSYIDENDRSLWLVVDNAHRDTVPPAARELVQGLIDNIGDGAVHRLALFVLGADVAIPPASFDVIEMAVSPLGRQDVEDFLRRIDDRYGQLGDFASIDEATDVITEGCDFSRPERLALRRVTDQLSIVVRSVM